MPNFVNDADDGVARCKCGLCDHEERYDCINGSCYCCDLEDAFSLISHHDFDPPQSPMVKRERSLLA